MASLLRRIKFYSKATLAFSVLGGCAVYGFLCSVVLSLVGKSHLSQWATARAFYYSFSTLLGIRIKLINGETLDKLPAIIIGNHQSVLDILILGRIFPKGCSVTSKKSLKYVPFLGWFMSLSGAFFIDRKNTESAKNVLNAGLKNIKDKKRAIFLFAEGKRTYAIEPTLLPLKKGAFHMAQQVGIPIIPIVASNLSTVYHYDTLTFESGEIIIRVLDPVPTEGLTKDDITPLSEKVHDEMLQNILEIGYSIPDNKDLIKSITNETLESTSQDYQTIPNEQGDDPENISSSNNSNSSTERLSLLSKVPDDSK
ncbi:hypothetical protein WICMUC_003173 [Wickerhamomyces mucosus]|uniref:1-acyl-sn-glycerol-3-phosphate acyltransferase n=1 Tax=Wickerhamomyces mucosus TaxID=1378264 RepID=A0A9P8PM76_9ASCO|nr:hypothetical protein WICMUC_003173 [Wickerhamomyces mucosus]